MSSRIRRSPEERIARLTADLESRARELAEAHRELESFSYAVSHDLRAPLRHMDGYAALLEKRLGTGLDEKSAHYMRSIRRGAGDLSRRIDGLLLFSRLGRQPLATRRFALGPIVRQAAATAERSEPSRQIDWRIADLPEVETDPALLRVVFDNLLSNAVKYTRPRGVATIEVEGEVGEGGERTIRVRDNGVGFDMRYAEKLFGVFQRLHTEREFEGAGIGLATVQRILHRLGGHVRGEAVEGTGATFHLTIPAPAGEL